MPEDLLKELQAFDSKPKTAGTVPDLLGELESFDSKKKEPSVVYTDGIPRPESLQEGGSKDLVTSVSEPPVKSEAPAGTIESERRSSVEPVGEPQSKTPTFRESINYTIGSLGKGAVDYAETFNKGFNENTAQIFSGLDFIQTKLTKDIGSLLLGDDFKKYVDIGGLDKNRPFKAVSEAIRNSNAGVDVPVGEDGKPTIAAQIVSGAGSIVPDILATHLMPQVSVGKFLGKYGIDAFDKFSLWLMGKEGTFGAIKSDGLGPKEQLTEPLAGAYEGVKTGLLFRGMGEAAGAFGGKVAEKLFGKTWKSSEKAIATNAGTTTLANSLLFGGYAGAEEFARTGSVSKENVLSNIGIGAALGIKDVAATTMNAFIAADKGSIKRILEDKTSAQEWRQKADENIKDAETNPENKDECIAAAAIANNIANIKAVSETVVERPDLFVKQIDNSQLPGPAKEELKQKVNEIVAENDPRIAEAKPITDKIDEINSRIETISNNPNLPQSVKDAQVKLLQAEIKELIPQAEEVFNKPVKFENDEVPEIKAEKPTEATVQPKVEVGKQQSGLTAYHGSPFRFEEFDASKIGTGEGAQAFGHGLYFTDLKDIAESYSKSFEIRISLLKSDIRDVTEHPEFFREGELERLQEKLDQYKQEVGSTYKVQIHGKSPEGMNWLEWDKQPTQEQLQKIAHLDPPQKLSSGKSTPNWLQYDKYNGQTLYRGLVARFNSEKAVSEFLLSVGIDGIKYPAESVAKGTTAETARGFNYVVFDDKAVTIEEINGIKVQLDKDIKDGITTNEQINTVANAEPESISKLESIAETIGDKAKNAGTDEQRKQVIEEIDKAISEVPTEATVQPVIKYEQPQVNSNKQVGEVFNTLVTKLGRSDVDDILFGWNESKLNYDGSGISSTPFRRDAEKGNGTTVRVSKKEFIQWLFSDAPFDEKVYGPEIKNDKNWTGLIDKARRVIGKKIDTSSGIKEPEVPEVVPEKVQSPVSETPQKGSEKETKEELQGVGENPKVAGEPVKLEIRQSEIPGLNNQVLHGLNIDNRNAIYKINQALKPDSPLMFVGNTRLEGGAMKITGISDKDEAIIKKTNDHSIQLDFINKTIKDKISTSVVLHFKSEDALVKAMDLIEGKFNEKQKQETYTGDKEGQKPPEPPSILTNEAKPTVATDQPETQFGREINPNPEVKANQQIAIKEVTSLPNINLKDMEAGFLYNMKNGNPVEEETSGLKGKIQEKLFNKGYIEYGEDSGTYVLSDKGKEFIDKVNARLETRRGVKAGTDMFPEMANIPEFDNKIQEIKSIDNTISDETIKRITDQDPSELEQSAKDIERKAESTDEAELVEAISKSNDVIGRQSTEKSTSGEISRQKSEPTVATDRNISNATSIQDLQVNFKDKAGTPEYNKRMEELRKSVEVPQSKKHSARVGSSDLPLNPQIKTDFDKSDLENVVSLRQIGKGFIDQMGMTHGASVRHGLIKRFRRKAIGLFFPDLNLIRVNNINDIRTLAHEMGHYLDESVFNIEKNLAVGKGVVGQSRKDRIKIRKELVDFTKTINHYKKDVTEGIAEAVNYYIIEPSSSAKLTPEFNRFFEKFLSSNPDIQKAVFDMQDAYQKFSTQDPLQIRESYINREEEKNSWLKGIKKAADNFTYKLLDNVQPIRELDKLMAKEGISVQSSESPTLSVLSTIGVDGKAKQFLENSPFEKNGNDITLLKDTKGLLKILKPIIKDGNLKAYEGYMTALHDVELHTSGKGDAALSSLADAQRDIDLYEHRFGKDKLEEFRTELGKYNDALLRYYASSGKLSTESLQKMQNDYRFYIPYKRFFDEWELTGKMPSVSRNMFESSPSPVKAIRGSQRQITSPFENIIQNTYDLIAAADRNSALGNIVGSLEKIQDAFKAKGETNPLIQKIPPNKVKAVKDLKTGETVWTMINERPKGKIITIYENGRPTYYDVDPTYYDSFFSVSDQVSEAIKWLSLPSRWLQAGAVVYDPTFPIRNIPRDQMSGTMYSKFGYNPIKGFVGGVADAIGKSDVYQKWLASGGDQSFLTDMDRMLSHHYLEQKVGGRMASKWASYKKNPLTLLQDISKASEMGTRVGAFKNAYLTSGDVWKSMEEARTISGDYGVKGSAMKSISPLYPFLNARSQHLKLTYQTIKDHPIRTAARGIMWVTAPTAIIWAMNNWSDEDKKRYQALPLWRRLSMFNIHIPGTDSYLPIPKGFWGTMFGTSLESFLDYAVGDDSRTAKGIAQQLFKEISPISNVVEMTPQFARPAIEQWANKKSFSGSPIVPDGMRELAPEEQYTDYSPEILKKLGTVTGLSPLRIDALIRGYTGGAGAGAVEISDEILQAIGIVDSKPEDIFTKLSRVPAAKALFTETPRGSRSSYVQDFISKLDEMNSLNRTVNNYVYNDNDEKLSKLLGNSEKKMDYEYFIKNQTNINKFRQLLSYTSQMKSEIWKDKSIYDKRGSIKVIDDMITETAISFRDSYKNNSDFNFDAQVKKILHDLKISDRKKQYDRKKFKRDFIK